MIKLERDIKDVKASVQKVQKTWMTRAARRTNKFITAGQFAEKTSIWSEIKIVFSELQNNRCAYCQRPLANPEYGSGEHDLEHYRPKGQVTDYPTPKDGVTFSFPTGTSSPTGYYWLAYHLENYAVSCIPCNRGLKLDRFPIAGTRATPPKDEAQAKKLDPAALDQLEQPLLLFPYVDDPEEYIEFFGAVPRARHKQGIKHQRATVTIAFFALADEHRDELFRARFKLIASLYENFQDLNSTSTKRKTAAKRRIEALCHPNADHSACARAYHQLLQTDPAKAEIIYEIALEYEENKVTQV
jgi:hypothetical protein